MGNRSTATLVAVLAAGALLAGSTGLPGPSAPSAPSAHAAAPPGPAAAAGAEARLGVDLDTVTIPELQRRMHRGSLTATALTRARRSARS